MDVCGTTESSARSEGGGRVVVMTDELGMREELSRMQVMLLQYAHLVLELRQQLPSAHERPEQIPAKLDALRSAISVSTPQHRPAAVTSFGQRAHKLALPPGGPISMMHGGHSSDAVQAELQQRPPTPNPNPSRPPTHPYLHWLATVQAELARLRLQVEDLQQQEARQRMEVEAAYDALGPASAEVSPGRGRPRLQEGVAGLRRRRLLYKAPRCPATVGPHLPGRPAPAPHLPDRPAPPKPKAQAATLCIPGARSRRRSRSQCSRARWPS